MDSAGGVQGFVAESSGLVRVTSGHREAGELGEADRPGTGMAGGGVPGIRPDCILIPDLVVVTNPGSDLTVWDPVDVAMIVEIVSPGSIAADRAIKPQLYAAAGIEHYLRIELGKPSPSSVAYRSQRDRYAEVASSAPGQLLRLAEPFPVQLDLAALAAATRPPG